MINKYIPTILFYCLLGCCVSVFAQLPGRVLHFPPDRSLGLLKIGDADTIEDPHEWWLKAFFHWKDLGDAQGDVFIPSDRDVVLLVGASGWQDLAPLRELPANSLDGIVIGSRAGRADLVSKDHIQKNMQYIAALEGVKSLVLFQDDFPNSCLEPLKRMQALKRLVVTSHRLGDTGLAHIAQVKTLTGLRVYSESDISGDGWSRLLRLTSLEELMLGGTICDNEGLSSLAELDHLRHLVLSLPELDASGLAHVSRIRHLERLEINKVNTEEMLLWISKNKHLKKLHIMDLEVKSGFEHIFMLDQLESLHIRSTILTDEMLAGITSLRNLKVLDISVPFQCQMKGMTDGALVHFMEMESLESLILYAGRYSDKGLEYLSSVANLKRLDLPNNPGFTDRGLKYLAKVKTLETLYLYGENFTDGALDEISKLENLTSIRFLAPTSDAKVFEIEFNRNKKAGAEGSKVLL